MARPKFTSFICKECGLEQPRREARLHPEGYLKERLCRACRTLRLNAYFLPKRPKPKHVREHGLMKLRFKVLKRDRFRCQYCGRNPRLDGCRLQVDHILPRSRGGLTVEDNLITACLECNLGKSDTLLS